MKKHINLALILLAATTVSRMMQKKQRNVFPIVSVFKNGTYTNNGKT